MSSDNAPDGTAQGDRTPIAAAELRTTATGPWDVRYHPKARAEANAIPKPERKAVDSAVEKLVSLGPRLPFPHSSKIMGNAGGALRELRPRAGRSPWRCMYQRVGNAFVIAAISPEAQQNKAGFERARRAAKARLAEIEP